MKFLHFVAILAVSASPAAQAQDIIQSTDNFCREAQKLNRMGHSTRPGSKFASYLSSTTSITPQAYVELWTISKRLGVPACASIW